MEQRSISERLKGVYFGWYTVLAGAQALAILFMYLAKKPKPPVEAVLTPTV